MKETEYLKIKNDLVDIIHAAFNDWEDYNEECYESYQSPVEDVEDYVADAVIGAGYRKQREGEWKLGKSGCMYFCSECNYAAHPREAEKWNCCPNCETHMRKEDESNG